MRQFLLDILTINVSLSSIKVCTFYGPRFTARLIKIRAMLFKFYQEMIIKLSITTLGLMLLSSMASAMALADEVTDSSEAQGVHLMSEFGVEEDPRESQESFATEWPFLRDAAFKFQLRSFYYDQVQNGNSQKQAWATGGSATFKSGYLNDRFAIGATLYTSQPFYAPSGEGGSNILTPGQNGYSSIGQIFLEVKLDEHLLASLGRKEYDTPFINSDDVRMTPKSFEGAVIIGTQVNADTGSQWRYGGGYISKVKGWTSTDFEWMSRVAGAGVDRGVVVAGASFKNKDFSLGAINYYSNDIINIFYMDTSYKMVISHDNTLKLGVQYSDQRSTGSNLLIGTPFSTYLAGIKADLGLGAGLLTLAYTDTSSGANIQTPWGSSPSYNIVQVEDFSSANESSVMLRAAYNFTRYGLEGLSASVLKVYGDGVKVIGNNKNETDVDIKWSPLSGTLHGVTFRLRYAHVDWRGSGSPSDLDNVRLVFSYDFTH